MFGKIDYRKQWENKEKENKAYINLIIDSEERSAPHTKSKKCRNRFFPYENLFAGRRTYQDYQDNMMLAIICIYLVCRDGPWS
jgi:hypothetical protein